MPATYLGSMTFGGAAIGVSADVSTVLSAVQLLLGRIAQLKASLEAAVTLTGSLEAEIQLQLLADIEVQIDANLAIGFDLDATIKDPSIFITGLASAVADLSANLDLALPGIGLSLDASVSANVALGVELGAKKLAIEALLTIVAQITGVANAAIAVALAAAQLPAVQAAANLGIVGAFTAPGVHVVRVSSPLASVGADLQGALAGAGIGGAVNVNTVVLLVETGNASGLAALNLAFAT